jgi:soluble lytic murein transglycosylase-like protein
MPDRRTSSTSLLSICISLVCISGGASSVFASIQTTRVHDPVAAAMRIGRYREALQLLTTQRESADVDGDIIRAALCHLYTGNPQLADSLLTSCQPQPFQRPYVDYFRAIASETKGDFTDAARAFDVIASGGIQPVSDSAAVRTLRAARSVADTALIEKAVNRLIERGGDLSAIGLNERVQLQAAQGDDWLPAWLTLLDDFRDEKSSLDAARMVDSLGWKPAGPQWISVARLYEKHGETESAVSAWRGALDDAANSDRIPYIRYHFAKLHVNNREYAPAVPLLDAILDDRSASADWPRAMRLSAKLERRRDRETRSRRIENDFINQYPNHEDAPDAMWQIAMSLERTRKLNDAIKAHERLARSFPATELAEQARWRVGLILYRQQHYRKAHRQLSRLARDAKDWIIKDQAGYWSGRALYASGEYAEANRTWDRVAAYSPRSYYAVIAALASSRPVVPPEDEHPAPTGQGKQPSDWSGFEEAAWLSSIGEWRWAREVLQLRTRGLARSVSDREDLADTFEAIGDYSMALRWRWRAMWGRTTEDRYHELTPDQLRRIWPGFFHSEVIAASQEHDVDPALIWAVIRQESIFNAEVTSSADARGLMQIIPRTGHALAEQLKIGSYDAMDLYDPALNVRLGTYYIRKLMRQFDDKVDYMASGYNAGPSNVARWRRYAGADHDLYRELITYSETRKYVKLVLKNYLIYRALYPDRMTLDRGDGGSS